MARKSTRPRTARHVEPEDESQEERDALEATEPDADEPKMSKVDAIRAALAAGKESPDEGTTYIRDRFGLEISKTHWSATKSQLKKKEGAGGGTPKGKRAAKGGQTPAATPGTKPEPKRSARTETPTAPSPDMIGDLEAVKALVKKLGGEQVKRIVDLFED